MPTRIDTFKPPKQPGGRPSKYDWDKLLDGSPWRLEEGTDFDCELESMRHLVRLTANKRGLSVKTYREGNAIVIQAFSTHKLSNRKLKS